MWDDEEEEEGYELEDDGDVDEKALEAIRALRKDYGPPEHYPDYDITGIIICTN